MSAENFLSSILSINFVYYAICSLAFQEDQVDAHLTGDQEVVGTTSARLAAFFCGNGS